MLGIAEDFRRAVDGVGKLSQDPGPAGTGLMFLGAAYVDRV